MPVSGGATKPSARRDVTYDLSSKVAIDAPVAACNLAGRVNPTLLLIFWRTD
jgi:hypothetical protein